MALVHTLVFIIAYFLCLQARQAPTSTFESSRSKEIAAWLKMFYYTRAELCMFEYPVVIAFTGQMTAFM